MNRPPYRSLLVAATVSLAACGPGGEGTERAAAVPEGDPAAVATVGPDPLDAVIAPYEAAGTTFARYAAASAFARIGDAATVTGLLRRFNGSDTPADHYARAVLAQRIVELDLGAALGLARGGDLRSLLTSALVRAYGGAETADTFVGAIVRSGALSDERAATLLRLLGTGDTATVVATLREADPASIRDYLHGELRTLYATDPDRAIDQILAVEDEGERRDLARELLLEFANSDPQRAFDAALKLGDADDYRVGGLQGDILAAWIKSNLAGAKAALFSKEFPLHRRHVDDIAAALFEQDTDAALEWAGKHIADSDLRSSAYSTIMRRFGENDAAGGVAFFASNPEVPPNKLDDLAQSFVREWAEHDPPAALAWALAQPDTIRGDVLYSYLSRTEDDDPASAFALLEAKSLTDEERARFIRSADELAQHDLPRYLALAAGLPSQQSIEAMGGAAQHLASDGFHEDAMMIIDSLGAGSEDVESATQKVIADIAQSDPAAAITWVDGFENPEARAFGIQNIIGAWARVDPAAAEAYARSLPTGSLESQRAALAMADRTLDHDPEGALDWLRSVEDQEMREAFIRSNLSGILVLAPDQLDSLAAGASDNLIEAMENEMAFLEYLKAGAP